MIVSIAIAVLSVWRSPMISSRWPRPIGIIASIAFRPVCIGSLTGWRWTTPGALNSAGRVSVVLMSPLPSSGWPSGETIRPSSCSPTGISSSRSVRLTVSPSTILSHGPNSTAPTLSDSRLSARPVTSCGSSSISNASQFSRPWMRAMPSATERTVPTSVRSAWPSSRPSMRLLRMDVISSGLICMNLLGLRYLAAKLFESVAHGGVEDRVADLDDDAAQDGGLHAGGQLDLATGLPGDLVSELLDDRLVELDGRGDLDREQPVLVLPHPVVVAADAEDHRHAVLLDQQLEEVQDHRVRARDGALQPVLLLLRGEVGREEEHLELARLGEGVGERAELIAHLVELVLVLGDLEQRTRVDHGDLFHQRSSASEAKSSSASASSTSRLWSASVSVLRVTFSVASTVRSATSARISWIARRVSASMSRRVCSIISSRLERAAARISPSAASPVLRARETISSAWPRASASRSRYSARISSASLRICSAVSIDSSIARWRRSSASAMRGKAILASRYIDRPKTSSVQIINPTSGVTRKLPPSSSP